MKLERGYSKLRFREPGNANTGDWTDGENFEDLGRDWIDCTAEGLYLGDLEDNLVIDKNDIETYEDVLVYALSILQASPTAYAMIREARTQGWTLRMDEQDGYDYTINTQEKLLTLDHCGFTPASMAASPYFMNAALVSLAKALRDIWQEKRQSGYENLFNAESVLLLERIRTADLCALAVLVAWELRGEGHGDIWRHMIGSEDGDLAMAFSNHLERQPASAFTHDALLATFQQWFRNEDRVDACDHETLDGIDTRIKTQRGRAFGDKRPTHIAVELFSCLPDRTAYLRGEGREILRNPAYCGLNDPINQAHFMQVLHDSEATYAGGIAFRNADLAARMFPNGGLDLETVAEEL